ncbi:MAG: hypothetical protein M3361_10420 [Candidatus Tectomicrobia bacterium]|jgi:hypothetical protein|nr:hypothetical protein [Candidatus Tectomicrobia bacterium]
MDTPQELSRWACGFCGATAAELSSPQLPPLGGQIVIRTHVLDVHEVLLADLEGSSQIGATWTLPDGRVWMREVRSEEA